MHVLDVFDHYRFRAVEGELDRKGKEGWLEFLETDDSWQEDYLSGKKGAIMCYFTRKNGF